MYWKNAYLLVEFWWIFIKNNNFDRQRSITLLHNENAWVNVTTVSFLSDFLYHLHEKEGKTIF